MASIASPSRSAHIRALAAQHGIDLTSIAGTGSNGGIRESDVTLAIKAKTGQHPHMSVTLSSAPQSPRQTPAAVVSGYRGILTEVAAVTGITPDVQAQLTALAAPGSARSDEALYASAFGAKPAPAAIAPADSALMRDAGWEV